MKACFTYSLAGILFVVLIGCSSREEKILAKVGKKKIRVREYEETIAKIPSTYTSKKGGIEGVKENLHLLLYRELLILEAQNRGIDKEKGFTNAWEQVKQSILYKELLRREIRDKTNIKEEEKKFETTLMTLFDVKFDQKTIAYLVENGKTAVERIPDISVEEWARPIVTFKGGKFTVGEYLNLLHDLKPKVRPAVDDSVQVMDFIRSVLRRVHLSNLAIQHFKIENDPEVASRLREKRLEMMIDELKRREVDEKTEGSQEEVEAYYQMHKQRYRFLLQAQAHIRAITVKTEGEARKLRRIIKESGDLVRLIERYKDQKERVVYRPPGSMEGIEIMIGEFHLHPFETERYGDLAVQAFHVPIGTIAGPVQVAHYEYMIFEVIEREDQGSPNSAHLIKAKQLAGMELRTEKATKLYNQFLFSLRQKYADQTVIFDDRLKLVKSPLDTTKAAPLDTTKTVRKG
jgi:hypothetical protein